MSGVEGVENVTGTIVGNNSEIQIPDIDNFSELFAFDLEENNSTKSQWIMGNISAKESCSVKGHK